MSKCSAAATSMFRALNLSADLFRGIPTAVSNPCCQVAENSAK